MPNIEMNFLGIAIAVVAGFMFCFLWNGVIFDKAIRKEMGISDEDQPQGAALVKGLIMTVVGIFLMTFVFHNNLAVWQPETWGVTPTEPMSKIVQAITAAFFVTLGFMVPSSLDKVAWEKRSWKFFAIEVGYYFFLLLIIALILLYV